MGRFQKHIFICINERPKDHPRGCCFQKGSDDLRAALKEELKKRGLTASVRANAAGCLDACEFGPSMVIYPEGVWYGGVSPQDIPEIIDQHLLRGNVVTRLEIKDPKYQHTNPVEPTHV